MTAAFAVKMVIGFLVGSLVGLSGFGGGVLLLPILIFGLGIPPLVAVGSDAAFNALTKAGASYLHWRRGTVNWKWVFTLLVGSIPGSFLGVLALNRLHAIYGGGVNDILRSLIGILLVGVPLLMLFERPIERFFSLGRFASTRPSAGIALIGLLCGILVGVSSVGSGSVVMLLLLVFLRCPPATLVGTDIVHALLLTSFASLLQFRSGNVDMSLVWPLAAGSIPGALLGVRAGALVPAHWLKRTICVLVIASGARMLWA